MPTSQHPQTRPQRWADFGHEAHLPVTVKKRVTSNMRQVLRLFFGEFMMVILREFQTRMLASGKFSQLDPENNPLAEWFHSSSNPYSIYQGPTVNLQRMGFFSMLNPEVNME